MTVKYAVQVLSSTMATVITHHGPPEASETAKFCKMMDSFFVCMNVRSYDEYCIVRARMKCAPRNGLQKVCTAF